MVAAGAEKGKSRRTFIFLVTAAAMSLTPLLEACSSSREAPHDSSVSSFVGGKVKLSPTDYSDSFPRSRLASAGDLVPREMTTSCKEPSWGVLSLVKEASGFAGEEVSILDGSQIDSIVSGYIDSGAKSPAELILTAIGNCHNYSSRPISRGIRIDVEGDSFLIYERSVSSRQYFLIAHSGSNATIKSSEVDPIVGRWLTLA